MNVARKYSILFAAFIGACHTQARGPFNKTDAIAIADRYVNERFAPVPPDEVRIVAEDHDAIWRVTFNPPEDSVGGSLLVDVDKQTGRVVRFYGEQ